MKRPKNITDYSFMQWANSPKAYHPSDIERFYRFVKTIKRYRNKKYLKYEYFKEQLNNCKGNKLKEKEIEYFYNEMIKLLEYDKNIAYSDYDFI